MLPVPGNPAELAPAAVAHARTRPICRLTGEGNGCDTGAPGQPEIRFATSCAASTRPHPHRVLRLTVERGPEKRGRHHIEHFRPRASYPDLELAYGNLFLSCGPEGLSRGAQPTCGNKKGNWLDEACHVEPAPEKDCQRRFAFASSGRIKGDGSPEADRMIEALNLNHKELVTDRSALIEDLDGELKDGVSPHELIKAFENVSQTGARASFANVALQYLGAAA